MKGEGFALAIGIHTGEMTSYQMDGRELLAEPLRPNLWRPPIDNDISVTVLAPATKLLGWGKDHWRGAVRGRVKGASWHLDGDAFVYFTEPDIRDGMDFRRSTP